MVDEAMIFQRFSQNFHLPTPPHPQLPASTSVRFTRPMGRTCKVRCGVTRRKEDKFWAFCRLKKTCSWSHIKIHPPHLQYVWSVGNDRQSLPELHWYHGYIYIYVCVWVFPQMVGFPTPKHPHPKCWSFFCRKTHGCVGETHHFRKPPNMKNRAPIFGCLGGFCRWTYHSSGRKYRFTIMELGEQWKKNYIVV